MQLRGRPETIVSNNGAELTSNAILTWADEMQIGWHYVAPGWACSRHGGVAKWL